MSEISSLRTNKKKMPRHCKASGTLWKKVPRKSGRRILRNYPLNFRHYNKISLNLFAFTYSI